MHNNLDKQPVKQNTPIVAIGGCGQVGVDRRVITTPDGKSTENEICWLYALRLDDTSSLSLDDGEVASVEWKDISVMKQEVINNGNYVPHGATYYKTIFEAVERLSDA